MWSVTVILGCTVWASAGASCAHTIDASTSVYSSTSGTVSVNTGYGGNHVTWCPDDSDASPCLDMVLRYTVKLGYLEIQGEDRAGSTCRVDRLWLGVNGTSRTIQLDSVLGTNSFTDHSSTSLESSVFHLYTPANTKCCFRFRLKGCIVGNRGNDSVVSRNTGPARQERGRKAVPPASTATTSVATTPITDVSKNVKATPPGDRNGVTNKPCNCCKEEEDLRSCRQRTRYSGSKERKSKEKDGKNTKKRKYRQTASGAVAEVHAFLRQRTPHRKGQREEDDSGLDLEAAESLLLNVLESEVNVTEVDAFAGNLTMDILEAVSKMMSLHQSGRHHRMILGADKFLRKLEKGLLRDKMELTLLDNNCKFRAERFEGKRSSRFQFDQVSVIVPPLESDAAGETKYSQVMVAILDSELGAANESSRITPIVSVNIGAQNSMTSSLDLQFTHVPMDRSRRSPLCVFMKEDTHSLEWSPSGIETIRMTDSTTVCKSSHLTNFAIIMQPVKLTVSLSDIAGLEVTSLIGCSVSITTLSITFIMLIGVRRASKRLYILKNLVLMLLLSQTVFLVGIDKTSNEVVCKTVAALLHYLLLACLTWMLAQGVELYFKVLDVFNQNNHSVAYTAAAYLTPLVIVGASLLKSYQLYGHGKYCWLSPDEGLVFAFIGPAVSVFTVNVLVLVLVMFKFNKVKANAKTPDNQKIKRNVRACVILLPVLGPTWIVGVFAVNSSTALFQYIFSLLNGLQGMLVLIFHCLLNQDVMTSWQKKIGLRQCKVHTTDVKVTTPKHDAWTGQFVKPKRGLRSVQDIFTVTTSKL